MTGSEITSIITASAAAVVSIIAALKSNGAQKTAGEARDWAIATKAAMVKAVQSQSSRLLKLENKLPNGDQNDRPKVQT